MRSVCARGAGKALQDRQGDATRLCPSRASSGPAIAVVIRAISTPRLNRSERITPSDRPTLTTTCSARRRVVPQPHQDQEHQQAWSEHNPTPHLAQHPGLAQAIGQLTRLMNRATASRALIRGERTIAKSWQAVHHLEPASQPASQPGSQPAGADLLTP